MSKTNKGLRNLNFENSNLFRIPCFEFWISGVVYTQPLNLQASATRATETR